jgi:hypothetical protein
MDATNTILALCSKGIELFAISCFLLAVLSLVVFWPRKLRRR